MASIGAVILAAGGSSRFGKPKQLVRFGDCTLVERTVRAAKDGGCLTIVVVTGSDEIKVTKMLDDQTVSFAENAHWRNGIGTSIRAGVERMIEIAPQSSAIIILVCDQPFVSAKVVNALIEKWSATGKSIVASSYSSTLGVPALFDSSCFNELLQLDGDTGAKRIILADQERLAEVPFGEGAWDVDTPEDYESLIQTTAATQPSE